MTFDLKSLTRKYLFEKEVLRLMGLVILVKPLGLATQMLMANFFGAGPLYDAYALAFFIVTFFSSVIGNVFTAVVVPFIIKLRDRLPPRELFGFQPSGRACGSRELLPNLVGVVASRSRGHERLTSPGVHDSLVLQESPALLEIVQIADREAARQQVPSHRVFHGVPIPIRSSPAASTSDRVRARRCHPTRGYHGATPPRVHRVAVRLWRSWHAGSGRAG